MLLMTCLGANLQPEKLETGEYINNIVDYYDGLDDIVYVLQVTKMTDGTEPRGTMFGGIPMVGGAYVSDNINDILALINVYAQDPFNHGLTTEAIYNFFMIPENFISRTSDGSGGYNLNYDGDNVPIEKDYEVDIPTQLDSYYPRNQKLLTFPFCYLLMENNNGSSNALQYEYFSNRQKATFKIKGAPTVGGSIKCIPFGYKKFVKNEEEGIIAGKFPTLNWTQDNYLNWLTQNAVNNGIGIGSDILSIASGVASFTFGMAGGKLLGGSAIANGVQGLINHIGQFYQHSLMPNSAKGNTNAGDINVCDKKNGFYFIGKSITSEYAEIIDKFFDSYGYATNKIKIPNLNNRPNWNYVKSIDINIIANIPQNDLLEIKKMFDSGLTLWHNPSTFLDYSQNNR